MGRTSSIYVLLKCIFSLTCASTESQSPDEVKENHSTYSKALLEYIIQEDSQFPAVKQAEILRAKRGDRGIDEIEGATMTGNLEHTPTEHR